MDLPNKLQFQKFYLAIWNTINSEVSNGLTIFMNKVSMVFWLTKWVWVRRFKQYLLWHISLKQEMFGDLSLLLYLWQLYTIGKVSSRNVVLLSKYSLILVHLKRGKNLEDFWIQRIWTILRCRFMLSSRLIIYSWTTLKIKQSWWRSSGIIWYLTKPRLSKIMQVEGGRFYWISIQGIVYCLREHQSRTQCKNSGHFSISSCQNFLTIMNSLLSGSQKILKRHQWIEENWTSINWSVCMLSLNLLCWGALKEM